MNPETNTAGRSHGACGTGRREEIMDTDRVLDVYRNGDEDNRLSLFLGYRELRHEFSRIDEEREVQLPGKGVLSWLRWIAAFL